VDAKRFGNLFFVTPAQHTRPNATNVLSAPSVIKPYYNGSSPPYYAASQICTASIKDNKSVRLEVHHAKTFDDICKENNITTVKGALACNEIWSLDNGISLCHGCHKNTERIRTELKNMFVI
jgi:hypothetical protein